MLCYAQEYGRGLSSVKCLASATTYGYLRYDIHARFAAHRCASARVDGRDPMADSVLIARPRRDGRRGARICPGESALRRDRRWCAVPGGEPPGEPAAGAAFGHC